MDPGGGHYNYPIVEYTCSASPPESEPEESVPDSDNHCHDMGKFLRCDLVLRKWI